MITQEEKKKIKRSECPYCENEFEIRPKYKFDGFFIYSNDKQMEKSKEEQ